VCTIEQKYEVGWRVSLALPVVLLLAEAVLLFFLPSSPRWLLAQHTPASEFFKRIALWFVHATSLPLRM
jgi:hypothetical protein